MNFLIEFLKLIGETREIEKVLATEIPTFDGKTIRLDFLCRFKDGTYCNIEFQFPVANSKDLLRFFDYNIRTEVKYDGRAETIIVNFTKSTQGAKNIMIGESKEFHPKIFYLGDIDFIKEMRQINIKLHLNQLEKIINPNTPNIQLTYKEELYILLMSLVPKYNNKTKLLKYAVNLLKNENLFHSEKIEFIKTIIDLEIDNFVPENEKSELKESVKMTSDDIELIRKVVEDVNMKYHEETKEEMRKEVKNEVEKETMKSVAKKLKNLHTPEEISNITGLSISTIIML